MKITVENWNQRYPVGTKVIYWPVAGGSEYEESETRSKAWALGDGHPVVLIKGRSGGVSLMHLKIKSD